MEKGWISLHRKIQENWTWDDPIYFKAWIAMLMQVNHQDNKVLVHGELIECNRGQSLLSLESWTKLFGRGWTKEKTRHFFKLLKKDSMIITENVKITTRLTVCNYDKYQNSSHTENILTTHRKHPDNILTTSNNNENNELKIINNENNVFSEKVFFEFKKFIEEIKLKKGKPVTEARMKALVENLNNIAFTDEEKILVIHQAISGAHSDFRPLPSTKKIQSHNFLYPEPYIEPTTMEPLPKRPTSPTEQEVIQYFDKNGYSKPAAEEAYFNFERKGWPGESIRDWKVIAEKNCFIPKNLKK